MKLRAGQAEFLRGVQRHRVCALVARRQYGKTTVAARLALQRMMERPGHDVLFASVKLDLGREVIRREAELLRQQLAELERLAGDACEVRVADAATGKMPQRLSAADFAELFEAQRLELRLYHSRTTYSRTKVIALTPSAVGETGDLITDEVGRVRDYGAVIEAVSPIIAARPDYRWVITTTPPPDDSHASYEQLAPVIGQEPQPLPGEQVDPYGWPIRPQGNWYRSGAGVMVLRVTAWDAAADGVPLYDDDTGEPISIEESRRRALDKAAWDRNYACRFTLGGAAACGLIELDTAQRRGVGQCRLVEVEDERELREALRWLQERLGDGPVGVGWDLATTERKTSHPSAVAVVERSGLDYIVRLVLVWRLADPAAAVERMRGVLAAVAGRARGGRARRLCVDATSERYFAEQLKAELRADVPVELVVASARYERLGHEPMLLGQYIMQTLVAELEDAHLVLPPERYLRDDWRLVRREGGKLVAEPDAAGRHADTFVAAGLAIWALRRGTSGRIEAARVGAYEGLYAVA